MAACKRRVEWQDLCRLAPSNFAFSRPGDLLLNKVKRLSRILGGKFNTAEDAAGYVFWRHSLGRAIFVFWGWVIRCSMEQPGPPNGFSRRIGLDS